MNLNNNTIRKNLFSRLDKFIFFLISGYFILDNSLLALLVFDFPIGIFGQIILIPLDFAILISSSPGSHILGIPASLTKAIDLPV